MSETESATATESDLTQSDVAAMTRHGPQELIDEYRSDAYDKTVEQWCEERPEDVEQLESAEEFQWLNCHFSAFNGSDGPEFEIDSGVEHNYVSDESEIADLAWEFVADWLSEYVDSIKRAQARSLFSRQELRVYWALANWSKKDIKNMLGVSYPAVSSYENRVEDDIERAEATLSLTYDD